MGFELEECYPEGVPVDFPVEMFAAAPALDEPGDLVVREAAVRAKIDAITDMMLALPEQPDYVTTHTFAGGVYARQLAIPKGQLVIGAVHLTEHFNVMLSGDITLYTIDGPRRVIAPAMFVSPAGTKKMVYTNEDSVWTNFHVATDADPEVIISRITAAKYSDFDKLMNRANFLNTIEAYGIDEALAIELSEDPDTYAYVNIPGVEVRPSEIAGQGLFATSDFSAGTVIGPASVDGKRTDCGRFINHHMTPNAYMRMREDGEGDVVALVDMRAGDEITTNYGATLALFLPRKGA